MTDSSSSAHTCEQWCVSKIRPLCDAGGAWSVHERKTFASTDSVKIHFLCGESGTAYDFLLQRGATVEISQQHRKHLFIIHVSSPLSAQVSPDSLNLHSRGGTWCLLLCLICSHMLSQCDGSLRHLASLWSLLCRNVPSIVFKIQTSGADASARFLINAGLK